MLEIRKAIVVLLALGLGTAGCSQSTNKDALKLSLENLEQRRLQTRYFDTSDEIRLLTSVTAVLQDFGFTIDDSESGFGLVVASKQRDASEVGQIVVAILVAAFTGAWMPTDDEQLMRASVVTRPIGDTSQRTAVRVTFQRIVWNTEGRVTHAESMVDPAFYQEVFAKLSKAVFSAGTCDMRKIRNALYMICWLTLGVAAAGCQSSPTATEMLAPGQSQVSIRSIQTRGFDTTDRTGVMRAVIATLQDLEFVIDQGDETLSMVGATKLDNYDLRMTVTARPRDESQTLVRANAALNRMVVSDAEFYQHFFVSLEHGLFLAAHGVD